MKECWRTKLLMRQGTVVLAWTSVRPVYASSLSSYGAIFAATSAAGVGVQFVEADDSDGLVTMAHAIEVRCDDVVACVVGRDFIEDQQWYAMLEAEREIRGDATITPADAGTE